MKSYQEVDFSLKRKICFVHMILGRLNAYYHMLIIVS